jgi:hypothetical protein
MRPATVYLGKLLGLFTLITSFWLLAERQTAVSTIPALLGDRPAMVIFAIIALAGGLAIVLAHNIWSGGVLPILVTLIGWVMVIRGVAFSISTARSNLAHPGGHAIRAVLLCVSWHSLCTWHLSDVLGLYGILTWRLVLSDY